MAKPFRWMRYAGLGFRLLSQVSVKPRLRAALAPSGAHTVSNLSITRVSANAALVHSLKAGNDIIVSM
jgi:hypothetical protein